MQQFSIERETAIKAVRRACLACREIRTNWAPLANLKKSDRSPVTVADYTSQALIILDLKATFPGDKIVGEEDAHFFQHGRNRPLLERVSNQIARYHSRQNEKEIFRLNMMKGASYFDLLSEKSNIALHTAKTIGLVSDGKSWAIQIGDYDTIEEAKKDKDILNSLGWLDVDIMRYRFTAAVTGQKPATEPVRRQQQAAKYVYTIQVVATKYKNEQDLVSSVVFVTTIASLVVIPFLINVLA